MTVSDELADFVTGAFAAIQHGKAKRTHIHRLATPAGDPFVGIPVIYIPSGHISNENM